MNSSTFRSIFFEENNQKIIKHSQYRKIRELIILLIFSTIGIGAIVVGIIFNEQSYFFRISLIIIGIIVVLLFSESFLTLMTNRIILTLEAIKFKRYFSWKIIELEKIISIELEKRTTRFSKENATPRFVNLIINTKTSEPIYFSLTRFRTDEAYQIVETIKKHYQEVRNESLVELKSSDTITHNKPLSEREISKQIPPKVEEIELEED